MGSFFGSGEMKLFSKSESITKKGLFNFLILVFNEFQLKFSVHSVLPFCFINSSCLAFVNAGCHIFA